MDKTSQRRAPDGFLWGSAISAHQTEGNNVNSDVWLLENSVPTVFEEPSGDACDSYHRYLEDFDLAAGLGFNCHRIGIEWARIEPAQGQFSSAALDHYRRALEALHARGLQPIVTFNHFTTPRWFAMRGGFEVADAADLFARFCARVMASMGDLVTYALPFNEANIQRLFALARHFATSGEEVDQMLAAARRATGSPAFSSIMFAPVDLCEPVMVRAQRESYAAIKAERTDVPVGLSLTMQDIQGIGDNNPAELVIASLYGPWLEVGREMDFTGVQTYTRVLVSASGLQRPPAGSEMTGAGYEFCPEALKGTIRLAHERIGKPVFVTESGICTDDDSRRIAFIDRALAAVRECLDDGIDVRSYICWSLLDNFEWTRGYGERFGLVDVDYQTFARTTKPSAIHLAETVRSGMI
ncbi:family 1 glycosylhydrolase [Qipengyuania sp. GH25]|uniref:Family 1 glycosylhydrolase n=1 Tax=Qipengyuania pacifica TaxID=2860199 RepID=A0ABS7JAD7_9SPHN|nr:family 1 glycosylhydrolase [Qipengyuania aerophila]